MPLASSYNKYMAVVTLWPGAAMTEKERARERESSRNIISSRRLYDLSFAPPLALALTHSLTDSWAKTPPPLPTGGRIKDLQWRITPAMKATPQDGVSAFIRAMSSPSPLLTACLAAAAAATAAAGFSMLRFR